VAILLGCALLLRALVPSGWMPAPGEGLAIQVCTDGSSGQEAASFAREAQRVFDEASPKGRSSDHGREGSDGTRKGQLCAFAGLSAPMLSADPPSAPDLAALAALAMPAPSITRDAPLRADHVRPPLRGPPATA